MTPWIAGLLLLVGLAVIALGTAQDLLLFLAAAIVGLGFWLGLTNYPAISLMLVVTGFYYYPFVFEKLGLQTSSLTSFGFWSCFSTSALVGYTRTSEDKFSDYLQNPIFVIFLLFLFWHGISWGIVSEFSDLATKRLGFAVFMMIIPFFTGLVMKRAQVENLLAVIIVSGIVGGYLAAFRFLSGNYSELHRFSIAESAGSLQFVYSLGTALLVLLSWTFSQRKWQYWILVASQYALVFFLVFAAAARGPMLFITAATLILLTLAGSWSERLKLFAILVPAALAVLSILPLLPAFALERFTNLFSWFGDFHWNLESDSLFNASGGRAQIWTQSFQLWTQSPWVGIGLAGTERTVIGTFAHNFILEIMVELGVVGLAIFACFFSFVSWQAFCLYRVYRNDHIIRSILIMQIFTMMSMLVSGQLQANALFWFSCGLIVSLATEVSKQVVEKDSVITMRIDQESTQSI